MRDLIEKVLKKGLSVSFSEEGGFAVIRICKGSDVVASCSLGSADFRASACLGAHDGNDATAAAPVSE